MNTNIPGVVDQVRAATRGQNRLATLAGFVLGGFVPCATYFVAHGDVAVHAGFWGLVVGGLVFSAKTVFDWGTLAFQSGFKALGFCVLVEGVMTFSTIQPLSIAALVVLCLVNGIATGCNLALNQREHRARRRAARQAVGASH
jgi:hypothetical protein